MDDKSLQALKEFAEKIGTTLEAAWPHYVEYTAAVGWTGLLFGSVLLLLGAVFLVVYFVVEFEESDKSLAAIIVALVCLVIGGTFFFVNLPTVLAPEGRAISHIVSAPCK